MSYNLRPLKRQRNKEVKSTYIVGKNGLCLTLWKHLIFPWLNMEDLAMLLRVCRAFNRYKDLRIMLHFLKKETFKGGLKSYMFNRVWYYKLISRSTFERIFYLVDFSCFKHVKYFIVEHSDYVFFPTDVSELRLFTSKDMLIRYLKRKNVLFKSSKILFSWIELTHPTCNFRIRTRSLTKQDLLENKLLSLI